MSDMQPAKTEQSIANPTQALSGLATILLVEDEALVREMTSEILESEGYRVLKTRNASEAMAIFRRHQTSVKLLLTDVVLPGQNGRDLAEELKKISPGLRTIFSSGYPVNDVNRKVVQDDSTLFLPKPFSAQTLLRKVSQVLGHGS